MIPYSKQVISDSDIAAVVEVLGSDFLTQGPIIPQFEEAVSEYVGAKFGIATNSATGALHVALCAFGIGSGDLVWTSPISFVASANCALYCGASIDFVDIEPRTFNMSVDALEEKLIYAELKGVLPSVIIVVHMCGQSADMKGIAKLAKKYKFKIIEDASHALGARYIDNPVGQCEYSDAAIFSFHPVKMITTGEGGMIVTNSEEIANRCKIFRSHGVTRDPNLMVTNQPDPWVYDQVELGYNYRLTDIAAALGLSQLTKLQDFIQKRRTLAVRYSQILPSTPLLVPKIDQSCSSSWHLYIVQLKGARSECKRRELFDWLREKGVGVNIHYKPIHLQPYYRRLGFKNGDFPEAEKLYGRILSLPLHVNLTKTEQDYVISCVNEYFDSKV